MYSIVLHILNLSAKMLCSQMYVLTATHLSTKTRGTTGIQICTIAGQHTRVGQSVVCPPLTHVRSGRAEVIAVLWCLDAARVVLDGAQTFAWDVAQDVLRAGHVARGAIWIFRG